jgi:hypothetical protein
VADIFISYSQKQPQPTRDLAAYLESKGYSVWWDTDLTSGEDWREVINREIDAAKAAIVIWTPESITSEWVLAEADRANRQKKLIPLRTRDLDPRDIPMPYGRYQTDFVDRREAILKAVKRLVGARLPPPPKPVGPPTAPAGQVRRLIGIRVTFPTWVGLMLAVGFMVSGAWLGLLLWDQLTDGELNLLTLKKDAELTRAAVQARMAKLDSVVAESLQPPEQDRPKPVPPPSLPNPAAQTPKPVPPRVSVPAAGTSSQRSTTQSTIDEIANVLMASKAYEHLVNVPGIDGVGAIRRFLADDSDAQEVLALGGTYDPDVLEKIDTDWVPEFSDPVQARAKYRRAADLGSKLAAARLKELDSASRHKRPVQNLPAR